VTSIGVDPVLTRRANLVHQARHIVGARCGDDQGQMVALTKAGLLGDIYGLCVAADGDENRRRGPLQVVDTATDGGRALAELQIYHAITLETSELGLDERLPW
jgi:hypothetical protein